MQNKSVILGRSEKEIVVMNRKGYVDKRPVIVVDESKLDKAPFEEDAQH